MHANFAGIVQRIFPLPVVVARKLSVDATLGIALFVVHFKLWLVTFAPVVDAVEAKAAARSQVFDRINFKVGIAVELLAIPTVVAVVFQLRGGVTHVGVGGGTAVFTRFVDGNYGGVGGIGVEHDASGLAVVGTGNKGQVMP